MDKKLLNKLLNGECKRSPELDSTICPDADVCVYTAETDKSICKIWNSSNDNAFNKKDICKEIARQILEEEDEVIEGRISADFNEIMFEITQKATFVNPKL